MEGKTALVLGGSGAIGKELVHELSNCPTYKKVVLITRRQVELGDSVKDSNRIQQEVVDFDNLDNYKESFKEIDVSILNLLFYVIINQSFLLVCFLLFRHNSFQSWCRRFCKS